jgi:tRNA(fMet)-specific endonuclease VapC
MSYLADTDWVIDYLKGREPAVTLLDSLVHKGLSISLITYGEIYEGIYYRRDPERHEQIFLTLVQATPILGRDEIILRRFARIRGQLRASGQIISDAELLIAATALFHNLTVVTQNVRHFSRISDLKLYPTA